MVPMNAPGVKLISRASYENTAAVMGTPFDYPLSSRLDENDAIFVLDNTFIPWEASGNAVGEWGGAAQYGGRLGLPRLWTHLLPDYQEPD